MAQSGYELVYGGSNLGLMGEVSGAALEAGGRVVGVIPTLFGEAVIGSQPGVEVVRVGSMAERKVRIMAMADVFVALPGGIGTLDEVSEVMVANQLGQMSKPLYLLNMGGFFEPFLEQLRVMREAGFVREGAEAALRVVADVEACVAGIGEEE